jgi:transposase
MKPIHLDPRQRQELQRRRHQTHDKRLYERLSAVLWVADGNTRSAVADLLGRSVRQLAEWLRLFRNRGLDALCTLHHQGDPGNLSAGQIERLKEEISTGRFRNSAQIRLWVEEAFGVSYTPSGIKDLLRRAGASYHKVTGFLWKAVPDKQHEFVAHYERQKAAAQRPGPDAHAGISLMPVTRSGAWNWSMRAGCWWGSVSWRGWAAAGSGSTSWGRTARTTRSTWTCA